MRIGFVGLGRMGRPIARRLVAAGHDVAVYNRTPGPVRELADAGAQAAANVAAACDHRADILHGINDPGPRYCPSCGAEATMRKQFAAPAIHFKGTGWAKKDRGGSGASTRASVTSSSSRSISMVGRGWLG